METKTKIEYLRLAEHFLSTHLEDCQINPAKISKTLINLASEYRPAYWRRLRRALAIHQIENGYLESSKKIQTLINPVTVSGSVLHKKNKQRRAKSVAESDHRKLIAHLKSIEDIPCLAAVMIVSITGCRPAEINSISLIGNQSIKIIGAKKIDGIRGCDRILKLTHRDYKIVELLLGHIRHDTSGKTNDMSRIQRRLQRHVKKLWPARKHHLSLYSYRHQLGSNLKSTGINKADMAEMMGHRSVSSIDVYGDRRTSQSQVVPTLILIKTNTHTRNSKIS